MKVCLACGHRFEMPDWLCQACGHEPLQVNRFHAFAPHLAQAYNGFRPEYFESLAVLEANNFWFRARNRLIVESLKRHFPDLKSFLEIGCGTGFVLSGVAAAYPSARLTGTEIFSEGLDHASRRVATAEFLQMDARCIPYDREFDVVGAFDVLEHILEDESAISQMYQAVRPRGGVLLTVPQHDWMWSRQDELACHVRRYNPAELRNKISRAGFRIIEMRSFVSLLLPVLWAWRHLADARKGIPDPLSELKLKPLTNRVLGSVMAAELALGRLGLSFPAGGSLLLTARKE